MHSKSLGWGPRYSREVQPVAFLAFLAFLAYLYYIIASSLVPSPGVCWCVVFDIIVIKQSLTSQLNINNLSLPPPGFCPCGWHMTVRTDQLLLSMFPGFNAIFCHQHNFRHCFRAERKPRRNWTLVLACLDINHCFIVQLDLVSRLQSTDP